MKNENSRRISASTACKGSRSFGNSTTKPWPFSCKAIKSCEWVGIRAARVLAKPTMPSLLVSKLHSPLADSPRPFQWHSPGICEPPQGHPNMEFIQCNKGAADCLSLFPPRRPFSSTSRYSAWNADDQLSLLKKLGISTIRINTFPLLVWWCYYCSAHACPSAARPELAESCEAASVWSVSKWKWSNQVVGRIFSFFPV